MAFESVNIDLDPEIVSRKNQDGTVIVMKIDDSDNFFKIDGVAAIIWKFLSEKKTLTEAFNHILSDFDVEESQLQSDIQSFVDTLKDKKLITIQ